MLRQNAEEEMQSEKKCQLPLHALTFSLHLRLTTGFHFARRDQMGTGSNGADECQDKQTVGDKTEKKMNVSER